MQELLPDWDAYLRLQTRSRRNTTVDSYSWGLEEEMNLFLTGPLASAAPEKAQLARAYAAGARRARAQAKMRKDYAVELAPAPVVMDRQLDACEALHLFQAGMPPENWSLLLRVAEGYGYNELARERKVKAGALRVLVWRLRLDGAAYGPSA